jgi:site-specific DNA recombinase
VIVHKVDRLARNRADDVAITIAIRKSGATLVSCSENIDETPSGLLLHGIMSSIAEFYSQNLATEVRKGMREKVKTGGTPTRSPIGYQHVRRVEKGREIRAIEIDPERAPFVRMSFEYCATGEWTLTELLQKVTDQGFTCRPGPNTPARPLTRAAFHNMLCNPYYVGEVSYRGVQYPGRHEPIISRELFDRVQSALLSHRHAGERQKNYTHYLKGCVFCGKCGGRLSLMNPRNHAGVLYNYFFCLNRQYDKRSCTQSVVPIEVVEKKVEEHYLTVQLAKDRVPAIQEVLRSVLSDRRGEAEELEHIETLRIGRLGNERERLLQLHYEDAIPVDLFKREMQRTTQELEQARTQLAKVSGDFDEIERNMSRALDLAGDCYGAYRDADPPTRRLFNQAFFEKIFICDHELAEPFEILLHPALPGQLVALRNRNRTVLEEKAGDTEISPGRRFKH